LINRLKVIVAGIDIGTNTALMVVGEFNLGELNILADYHSTPRLGRGLTVRGTIDSNSIEECATQLQKFRSLATIHGAQKIEAVATAALRNASNRDYVVRRLSDALCDSVRVIDPTEEAELTLKGVLGNFTDGTVLDVGGGSTEVVTRISGRTKAHSFPIGAVYLTEIWHDLRNKHKHVLDQDSILQDLFKSLANVDAESLGQVFAVAGTPVSLAILESGIEEYDAGVVDGFKLDQDRVRYWTKHLLSLDKSQVETLQGIDPGRADILAAGSSILLHIMQSLSINSITV
jgi:exopolyphosphatase / guanosine-5'-triphosphate,3'-diphosphate pyrophosphatase